MVSNRLKTVASEWWVRLAGSMYLPGPGPRFMSWARQRWVFLRNPRACIEFRGPVYLGPGFSVDMPHGGTLIVGPNVEFRRGFRAEFGSQDARITIGANCVFTYDVVVQCTTSIDIGQQCVFAQGTTIADGSHRFRDPEQPMLQQGYNLRPIRVGDYASVMAKATIIADVGEHSFVAANAVVTAAVPPYCLAAGVPARVIDSFADPDERRG